MRRYRSSDGQSAVEHYFEECSKLRPKWLNRLLGNEGKQGDFNRFLENVIHLKLYNCKINTSELTQKFIFIISLLILYMYVK